MTWFCFQVSSHAVHVFFFFGTFLFVLFLKLVFHPATHPFFHTTPATLSFPVALVTCGVTRLLS